MDASLHIQRSIHDGFLRQYRIILSADTASEVRQLPERCLSRKAGIVRCCLYYSIFTRVQKTGYISVRDGSFAFIGLLFL